MFCRQAEEIRLAAAGKARKQRHDRESRPRRESEPVGDAAGERLPAFGTDRATAVGVGCAHVIPPEAKRRSRDRGLALLVLEGAEKLLDRTGRSEEHTSELQSLMRISYAVFCLKKTKDKHTYD